MAVKMCDACHWHKQTTTRQRPAVKNTFERKDQAKKQTVMWISSFVITSMPAHHLCHWGGGGNMLLRSKADILHCLIEDIRCSAVLTEIIRRQRRNTITIGQQRS